MNRSPSVVAALTRLRQDLRRFELEVRDAEGVGARAAARVMKAAVIREAPKDTGFLASQVKIVTAPHGSGVSLYVVIDDRDFVGHSYYAAMVEYGTSKMPANPFMRRAIALDSAKAMEAARAAFTSAINARL